MAVIFGSLTGSYSAGAPCLCRAYSMCLDVPYSTPMQPMYCGGGKSGLAFLGRRSVLKQHPIQSLHMPITLTAELADDISLRHTQFSTTFFITFTNPNPMV